MNFLATSLVAPIQFLHFETYDKSQFLGGWEALINAKMLKKSIDQDQAENCISSFLSPLKSLHCLKLIHLEIQDIPDICLLLHSLASAQPMKLTLRFSAVKMAKLPDDHQNGQKYGLSLAIGKGQLETLDYTLAQMKDQFFRISLEFQWDNHYIYFQAMETFFPKLRSAGFCYKQFEKIIYSATWGTVLFTKVQ